MYELSNKVFGADNQQERLELKSWIVGFTDGEGTFSVSIIKNKTTKSGWQVFPEFVITQGEKSLHVLKTIREYFGCGSIFVNKRYDNHTENLYRFCVRSLRDLNEVIIPFFDQYQLQTAKKNDFLIFKTIIAMLLNKEHLTDRGLKKIAQHIEKMNRKKQSRFLESLETIRQASHQNFDGRKI